MKIKINKKNIPSSLWYSKQKYKGKIFSVYKTKDRWGVNYIYHLTNRSIGQMNRYKKRKIYSAIIYENFCKVIKK